jgi:hypothetical protein
MIPRKYIRYKRLVFIAIPAILIILAGCAVQPFASSPAARTQSAGGIKLVMHDNSTAVFPDNQWSLTFRGVRGTGSFQTLDGACFTRDTTISFWEVSSASAVRGNTLGQFMLTVLGIILVIGLAAIILYAAFLATDR